jgi:hypothetical protein
MSLKFLLPIWQKEKAAGVEAYEFANQLAEEIWCDFVKGQRSKLEGDALALSVGSSSWSPNREIAVCC